ncbi:hypothetical protein SAMN05216436_1473 [bacterium A37T11]|nr:hypothetical protein SAMN05216436_1473 [bacterium A37T11]
MGTWKKIRKVALVENSNAAYREYCVRQSLFHMHLGNQWDQSQTSSLSHTLESTVRAWVSAKNRAHPARVLTWEVFQNERYRRYYREIDFIIPRRNGGLAIGELKVSSNPQCVHKACDQLIQTSAILERVGIATTKVILWINVGFRKNQYPKGRFTEDFSQVKLSRLFLHGHHFVFLQLRPEQLYTYGLTRDIIRDPRLLDNTYREVSERRCNDLFRRAAFKCGLQPQQIPFFWGQPPGLPYRSYGKFSDPQMRDPLQNWMDPSAY